MIKKKIIVSIYCKEWALLCSIFPPLWEVLTRGCIIAHYILFHKYHPTLIVPKDVCVLGLLPVIGGHISITNGKGIDITDERKKNMVFGMFWLDPKYCAVVLNFNTKFILFSPCWLLSGDIISIMDEVKEISWTIWEKYLW